MKIVCIYGQNHKGSTYHIAKIPWEYVIISPLVNLT